MNRLLRFAFLVVAATACWACDDDKETIVPGLEVTPNNIAGTWQLDSWNGAPLAEGSYVYIEFVRKDRTYSMYQNVDSFGPRKITGEFAIYTDPELGSIIRGLYDYGAGDWQNRYIVRELTKESMTWIVKGDDTDISVYTRCDAIPEEIVDRQYND